MTEYYNIVPWYDSREWLEAYDNIYIKTNRQVALNVLHVWKSRCPSLPSGIESTLTLLEVLIKDDNNFDNEANDQLLRLAYSSAIMRFVNHMLDTETVKGSSLYQAARNLGVPDWIIDLRHDTAHSNKVPSIELLREASQIGLGWLEKNYWLRYKMCISDYISGKKDDEIQENDKIAALINFCTSLSFCAHSKCKIKNLSEIPNASMRESIVNDARDLFGNHYDFSNLKTISVVSLINVLNIHSKKLLKSKDASLHVNKALLGEDSLFLSLELVNFLGCGGFYKNKKLTGSYVQCFEVLLTFLHTHDMLLDFIIELIEVTHKTVDDENKSLLAALWVSEILKTFGKSKLFTEKMKESSSVDLKSKKRQELRSLYHHWFPNEKIKGLLFDLQKPVPAQLMNINYLQPILTTYNPYLKFFVRDLIDLVEPRIPEEVAENIYKLAKLITSPDNSVSFSSVSSKIYTVCDLDIEDNSDQVNKCLGKRIDNSMDIDESTTELNQNAISYGIWKFSSGNYDWSSCPIGMLPWQQTQCCHE